MKSIFAGCCLGLLLCLLTGCKKMQSEGSAQEGMTAVTGSVPCDTMLLDSTLGRLTSSLYKGVVRVDGNNLDAQLYLVCQEHSGDGRFSLKLRTGSVQFYAGRRYTLRGTQEDRNATVWQLVANDSVHVLNFLCQGDSILIQLSDQCGKLPGEDSLLLKREYLKIEDDTTEHR